MQSAFIKDILRSIKGSLGRFLAIMGIVALGCGFYAGLQMCGPDMRGDADAYYDGTNLWDLRLISTMGFADNDVERVRAVGGVENIMPSLTCDAMARIGTEQIAVRVSSLDVEAARRSKYDDLYEVRSDDPNYLNRPVLVKGRWPQASGECVICADVVHEDIGIGDTVQLLYGASDLDDLLGITTFEIVGMVTSSNYPYTGSFGSTNLGTGMIDQYLYVAPASLAEDASYTEIYLTVAGAAQEESESEAYTQVVDVVKKRFEDLQHDFAVARQADLKAIAQDKVDEKWDEYYSEKAKADQELADAKAELDDAAKKLADGERELADGEAQYADGLREFEEQRDSAWQSLDDAAAEIERNQQTINEKSAELDAGARELEAGRAEAQAKLAEGEAAWQAQRAPLAQTSADLGSCLLALETIKSLTGESEPPSQEVFELLGKQLEDGVQAARSLSESELIDPQVKEVQQGVLTLLQTVLGAYEAVATTEEADLSGFIALLENVDAASLEQMIYAEQTVKEQIDAGIATGDKTLASEKEKALATLDESQRQLDEGRAQLADGQRQLDDARWQLEEGRETARAQLAEAQATLDDAARELADARAELADGRRSYEDGLSEYEKGKAEADEKFGDAYAQLTDAQKEIDEIELPDVYVLDRSQSEGAATYHADTERIDAIADVFPFIFFLVAALVSLTTMTRMVEDERILIGTYKALGYGTWAIAAKYLAYAGVAGTVGATVGILILSQVLPYIVMSSYDIIYVVPIHPFLLPVSPSIALMSGGMGVGVTLLATWGAVLSSLREVPATLMLPRAPKAGKRILLERVTPVWKHLSFTWKVTCRNLFRYKRRFLMTVIGISGCTALLLVGFGLHDAIWDIIDRQYGPIIHFDTTIGLDDTAMELDVRRVCDYLTQTGEVTNIVRVQNENMQAGTLTESEKIRVNVVIPRREHELTEAVTFKNRISGEQLSFDKNSVIVTEKLALKYGLEPGSTILLYDQDDVGNAVGEGYPLVVTGVAENYVGNYVYLGRDAWAHVSSKTPTFSTIYASVTQDDAVRSQIADTLHDTPDVSIVSFSDETIEMYRNMLSVVDLIVVVLIVSAAALAYIVLYNLTNINIGERIREIASLKVLGFTRGEVYTYIFREIALLALIGDTLGMVLGIFLERFVVTTAEVDYVMFGRSIHGPSFAYAFALTMVFTLMVILSMRRKLDRVDMVESLKSVD